MTRIYEGGRDTGRWTRGEKITSMTDIEVGDVLYEVSHQWSADNLIRVTGRSTVHADSFYARHLNADLSSAGHEWLLWAFEHKRGGFEVYKVVADPNYVENADARE